MELFILYYQNVGLLS